MHEMSLATELIGQVLRLMAEHNLAKVDEVEVEVGVLRQVMPEAMHLAWETVSEDTPAEGSKLKLDEIAVSAECRNCSFVFQPEIDNFVCPQCGQADIRIEIGNEVVLKSLSGETTEERAGS